MGILERNQKMTEIKRDEIIRGMEEALQSKSYNELTIDDVAKKAEYSKKTIYSYFRSKDEIYLELLIRKFNLLYDQLNHATAGNDKRGIEKIRLLGQTYYKFSKDFPEYMQAIIDFEAKSCTGSSETDNMIKHFNEETGKSYLLLEDAIKEAIEDNEISNETDVSSIALFLWSSINGFITLSYKKGEYIASCCEKPIDTLFTEYVQWMIRSLTQNHPN